MGYLTGYELFLLGTTASCNYSINVIYSIEAVRGNWPGQFA